MNYEDYINSSDWRKKRNQRLVIDNYECQVCCSNEDIEVHHRHYKTLFNETVETDLISLCKLCHDSITSSLRKRKYNQIPIEFIDSIRITPIRDVIKGSEKCGMEKIELRDCKRVSPTYA